MSSENYSKRPLTVEAYEVIKKRIIDLEYRPGEILLTQQVANELGISRTPVREALVKLSEQGLLGQTDSRKFQVAPITTETIHEIYSLRENFEILALTHVFESITKQDIKIMQDIITGMKRCLGERNTDEFFELDNRFHDYIIKKYNNHFLINFVEQLKDYQQRVRYVTVYVADRMESTIPEHEDILENIINHDLNGACTAIKRHLDNVEYEIFEFLNKKGFYQFTGIQTIKL